MSSPDEEAVRVAVQRAGYRGLLKREPEATAVDPRRPPLFSQDFERSLTDIIQTFADSAEFSERRGDVGFPIDTWVQMLVGDHVRLWIDLGDTGVSCSCLKGIFEPVETQYVLGLLRPGMTFVDVGANIGWFAVQAADRVGADGRVIAFEPRPTTSRWLKRSMEDNHFSDRAEVHACAVGPTTGEINIGHSRGTNNPGGTWSLANEQLVSLFRNQDAVMIKVPMVTLDEVIGDRRVDVVKIDIEGAEPFAMAGAMQVLRKQRPIIVSEINPNALEMVSNVSAHDYVARLKGQGYRCFELGEDGPATEYDGQPMPSHLDMINVVFLPE